MEGETRAEVAAAAAAAPASPQPTAGAEKPSASHASSSSSSSKTSASTPSASSASASVCDDVSAYATMLSDLKKCMDQKLRKQVPLHDAPRTRPLPPTLCSLTHHLHRPGARHSGETAQSHALPPRPEHDQDTHLHPEQARGHGGRHRPRREGVLRLILILSSSFTAFPLIIS